MRQQLLNERECSHTARRKRLTGFTFARALANLTDDAMEGVSVTIENVRTRSNGAAQCGLIRCVFPLRPVTVDPAWRTDTVVSLASQMYDTRDFSAMPILADVLQDAGCNGADILDHCREANQVHVERVLGRGSGAGQGLRDSTGPRIGHAGGEEAANVRKRAA